MASILRLTSHELQETTIAGEYVKDGSEEHGSDEISIEVTDLQGALDALKESGIDDFTINETDSTIEIIDFEKGKDLKFKGKRIRFVEILEIKNIEFEKEKRRAIRSALIGQADSREILGRFRQAALQQRQGGAVLREIIERANERQEAEEVKGEKQAVVGTISAENVRHTEGDKVPAEASKDVVRAQPPPPSTPPVPGGKSKKPEGDTVASPGISISKIQSESKSQLSKILRTALSDVRRKGSYSGYYYPPCNSYLPAF